MTWGYSGPGEIVFGEGAVRELGRRASAAGTRAFVVTGRDSSRAFAALDSLRTSGIETAVFPASGEPTFDTLRSALGEARRFFSLAEDEAPKPGALVIGFGGGSALDLAKGAGILLANPGDPLDYAEVIGSAMPFRHPSAPVIAVPTTAGTGSEATKNAVFSAPDRGVKVSLRSLSMFPRIALVDPELSYSLPPVPTAHTGMDALTQVLEPFVSIKANPVTDALCAEALADAPSALLRAFRSGAGAREARGVMSRTALFSGLALGNAGLGAVHGLAAPLCGRFPLPHGAACAALLVPGVRVNIRALRERAPDGPGLRRYARAAALVTGKSRAEPEDLAEALAELASELGIEPLGRWGVRPQDIPALAADSLASNSMKGNPIPLTESDAGEILRQAL